MIFIDTAPFIYLIEKHPENYEKVKDYLTTHILEGQTLVSSVISISEFLVQPFKLKRDDIVQKFNRFLSDSPVEIIEVSVEVAELAAKLRGEHSFLQGMDALQIAIYFDEQCTTFLTNDKRLKKVPSANIVLVDEL